MQPSPSGPLLLGLLSDAHGDAAATARAADLLVGAGAATLIYLGDACADGVLDALAGLRTPAGATVAVHLVAGNCDRDPEALRRYAAHLDLRFHDAPALLELGGRRIVFAHGHEAGSLESAQAWKADYFLHGHLHRRLDEREGSLRVICAGSVASPRDGLPPACALLDITSGKLRWIACAPA